MLRRLLTLLVAALVVVAAAGCERPTGYAARVGKDTISEADLQEWMDVFAASPTLQQPIFQQELPRSLIEGAAPSSYTMQYADAVLGILIEGDLHEQEFQRRHLESDSSVEQSITEALPTLKKEMKAADVDVPDDFESMLVSLFAHRNAVVSELADGWQAWVTDQYARDDIEVNDKYGSWSPTSNVLPPPGPLPAPAGS